MNDLTIIIPAYNEAAALDSFLPELLGFCREHRCRLIIVNDGSRDNTRAILDRYADEACFTPIHHKVNCGYGGAIKTGIDAARTKYLITIDADGQHRLEDVVNMYHAIIEQDADLVIGRRVGARESLYRKVGKSIIHGIARLLMQVTVEDLNSGIKIYRTDLAQKYIALCPDNMPFSDIITLVFINQRHLVSEYPVTVLPRTTGKSTISTKTAFDTVMEILHIMTFFNPMRIFLPTALFFLFFSAIWGLPIILRGEGVSVGTLFLFVTGLLFFSLGLIAEQLVLIRKSVSIVDRRRERNL